jgi:hypothetical protein
MPLVVLACAAAGHGLGRTLEVLRARSKGLGAVVAMIVALALVGPASMSTALIRKLMGADTRSLALAWIDANVPAGSYIVREEYTPQPDPERYRVEYTWSLGFGDPRDYRRTGVDYLVASQAVYARFLDDPLARYPEVAARYRDIFALRRVAEFVPHAGASGPAVSIYRTRNGGRRNNR